MIDVTGTALIPGNQGKDCPGNGEHTDKYGNHLECCCDECDYLLCCLEPNQQEKCQICIDHRCPRAVKDVVNV